MLFDRRGFAYYPSSSIDLWATGPERSEFDPKPNIGSVRHAGQRDCLLESTSRGIERVCGYGRGVNRAGYTLTLFDQSEF